MLVTVTNVSGGTINAPEQGGYGRSPDAVGGARSKPLPYPFAHIGSLANGGTKQLPMHPEDLRFKSVPWLPLDPRTEWQQMVQAKMVTLTIADQAGVKNIEELMIIELGN
jgi:hypothetical protein